MSNEERERRLPKWARDELRELRRDVKVLEKQNAVLMGEAKKDPLRGESQIYAIMDAPDSRRPYDKIPLPTHEIVFDTPGGNFSIRTPVFDHERGIRVSCGEITIQCEASNVITLTGRKDVY